MTDPDDFPTLLPPAAAGDRFAEGWNQLSPSEQRLVAMAVEAVSARQFSSFQAWQRFVDSATDLLILVESGALTVEQLHALALDASRADLDS